MILSLCGEINHGMLEEVITFFNNTPADVRKTVYIDSNGGNCEKADIILRILNDHHDTTTLIAVGRLYSSAFYIFYLFLGKRELVFPVRGLYHLVTDEIRMSSNGEPQDNYEKIKLKIIKKDYKNRVKELCRYVGMKRKHIKRILAGKDVSFTTKQLTKFLKNTQ